MNSERTVEKLLHMKATKQRIPLSGSLELLPLCNMDCDMCYIKLTTKEMKEKGRLRTVTEWLSLATEMKQSGVLFLTLTGGEPLLYPNLKELYIGLKELGMIITINTNGTLLDERWISFFKQHPPRRMNVTLYGVSNETYETLCHYKEGYERVIQGIKRLREEGIAVKLNGSLVQLNEEQVTKLTSLAKTYETAINIDTYMYPVTREREREYQYDIRLTPKEAANRKVQFLQEKMGKEAFCHYAKDMITKLDEANIPRTYTSSMTCHAGKSFFNISWRGELKPCVMLSEPSIPVFDVGFFTGWKLLGEKLDAFHIHNTCCSCKLRPICGTCVASAKAETGAYDQVPEYLCQYSEHFVQYCREYATNEEK